MDRDYDQPLDVERWAGILAEHLGPLDVVVGTEPGDFLLKESAAMLAEVVTVEERDGVPFVGLDAGWNLVCERFVYQDTPAIVLCRAADAEPEHRITVSGNINEGPDLFAEELPFPDESFDTVLSTHVLCSVPRLERGLAEVRRVLKLDGQFRFFEHVRSRNAVGAFAQDAVLPVWRWFGAGCHPNRDIAAAVQEAGFELVEHERMRPFSLTESLLICAFSRPHVFGVAMKAAAS